MMRPTVDSLHVNLCLSFFSAFNLWRVFHLLMLYVSRLKGVSAIWPRKDKQLVEKKTHWLVLPETERSCHSTLQGGIGTRGQIYWLDFSTACAIRGSAEAGFPFLKGVSCPWSMTCNQGQRTETGDQCHMVARCWAIISDTFEDLCFTHFHEKLRRYPDHGHNTSFFFWPELSQQIGDLHVSVIENSTNGRSQYTTDWGRWLEQPLEDSEWWQLCLVQGPGSSYLSHPGGSNCLRMFGYVCGLCWCWHNFSRTCIFFIFLRFQFCIYTFWEKCWCFDSSLTAISTQNSYQSDDWDFHDSLVPSHLPFRLRQWPCSRLCWCPACEEALVSGKWFAHWQCILCWQRPIVFTVWWINGVDRLTCSHCDTLGNNILKQLLKSQLDITWNWFPSTPGEVQNLSCQKIEHCTKQMNRMHVCNALDHGRLDAQTSLAGFVQQQWYCKNIQLMKRSESQ